MEVSDHRQHQVEDLLLHPQEEQDLEQDSHHLLLDDLLEVVVDLRRLLQPLAWVS